MKFNRNIYPFYHTISDKKLSYINNLYPQKSIEQFQRELDFFQKNYQNISMKELIELKNNNLSVDNNYFHLSFDDGLKECSTLIGPILKERNLDATFFINPNFINNKKIFYRYKVALILEYVFDKKLREQLLIYSIHDIELIDQLISDYKIKLDDFDIYMNEDDINILIEQGFSIGAHSMNHPYYRDVSFEEQLNETNESLDFLQQIFNLDYRIFSFPFTDNGVSRKLFDCIDVDLSFGTAGIKDDEVLTNIHRLPMDNCLSSPAIFIYKNRLKYYLQKQLNKHIVYHS